jgi:hypothetical protein
MSSTANICVYRRPRIRADTAAEWRPNRLASSHSCAASPRALLLVCGFLLSIGTRCIADDESAIAKQAQNPIASMISVPFQNNLNFGVGPKDGQQNVLDIQPVVPFNLTDDWNLITRTIVPVIYEPYISPAVGNTTGLGDAQVALYLSPATPRDSIIWGIGPVISLPTATDRRRALRCHADHSRAVADGSTRNG